MTSSPQCMEALERANKVRLRRARLKREIRAGDVRLSSMVREGFPDWLRTMAIGDLIEAVPRLGPKRVEPILVKAQVRSRNTVLGFVTKRQRLVIAPELERWEAMRWGSDHLRRAA